MPWGKMQWTEGDIYKLKEEEDINSIFKILTISRRGKYGINPNIYVSPVTIELYSDYLGNYRCDAQIFEDMTNDSSPVLVYPYPGTDIPLHAVIIGRVPLRGGSRAQTRKSRGGRSKKTRSKRR